jgi:hypothetical protein
MAQLIGMEPEQVTGIHGTLKGQIGALESVSDAIVRVRLASLTPSSYGVPSGSLVVAPQSIATVTAAIAHLGSAKSNAESLIAGLLGQVVQQQTTSSAATGALSVSDLFATVLAIEKPVSKTIGYIGYATSGVMVADRIAGIATLKKAMPKSGLTDWTQDWEDLKTGKATVATDALDADGVFQKINKVARFVNDTPVGKALGIVGVGLTAVDAVEDFHDGHVGDGVADTIETVLGTAALLTPPPADVILGVAAIGVGVGQFIADNHVVIGKDIGKAASAISSVATNLGKGIGDAEKDIGKGLASAFGSLF